MYCSNCGKLVTGKFCSECGAPVNQAGTSDNYSQNESTATIINGVSVDLSEIHKTYGKDKIKAIKYLCEQTGLGLAEAKKVIDNAFAGFEVKAPAETKGFWAKAMEQANQQQRDKLAAQQELKARIAQMDRDGIAYCPKCYSTSLSANKKGFGIGKAVVGAALTGGIGLIAGNIGAKKVRVTCLKCGHQFWAGQK